MTILHPKTLDCQARDLLENLDHLTSQPQRVAVEIARLLLEGVVRAATTAEETGGPPAVVVTAHSADTVDVPGGQLD